jgi:hypothetical protein
MFGFYICNLKIIIKGIIDAVMPVSRGDESLWR